MSDRVAEVLDAHQMPDGHREAYCICGAYLDERFGWVSLAAHQADALRAKGLVAGEVEWAADLDGDMRPTGGRTIFRDQLERTIETWVSRGNPRPRVITRGVTPWRTADEGSES